MKTFLLTGLAALYSLLVLSQKPTINWITESKENVYIFDFISINAGKQLVKLSSDDSWGHKPMLTLYDGLLTKKNEIEYFKEEKYSTGDGIVHIQGNSFAVTHDYNRKHNQTSQHAQKFNGATLLPEGKQLTLGIVDGLVLPTATFQLSKDSLSILMFARTRTFGRDKVQFYMAVFDKDLREIWHQNIELPMPSNKTGIAYAFITNNREVGVLVNSYERLTLEKYDPDDTKTPAYTSHLLLYAKDAATREVEFDLKDKFLHTLDLVENKQNNLSFFGLYKSKSAGPVSGFFKVTLDNEAKILKPEKLNVFPPALVSLVANDDQGSEKDNDPGLSVNFKLINVLQRENGSIDYLLQFYQHSSAATTGERGTLTRSVGGSSYMHGDMIDIHIQPTGQISYVRVPTCNYNGDTPTYGSVISLVKNNKLLLFYNEHRDNLEKDISAKPEKIYWQNKSVFLMAVIDEKDKLTRSVVFENTKSTIICPLLSRKITDNRVVLVAIHPKTYTGTTTEKLGFLEIQ